jgi:Holliday junction DNA helicase RuvA
MIASVSGRVKAVRKQTLVVDVGGVGFEIAVVNALLEGQAVVGQPIDLYTHMHVREAEISLYGFVTLAELDLFTTLLRVSGVGPRTALAVLSTFSPETLRGAIAQGNVAALTRIPGIGAKTAQRLVLDLKDKIGLTAAAMASTPLHEGDADVLNALTALGYSLAEAQSALRAIPADVESLDQRILAALRSLGSG